MINHEHNRNTTGATMNDHLKLMRFDKPIGTLLLLWPTLAALWLANAGMPPLKLIIVFTLGVVIMRAAGCIVNDLCDRNIDKGVARTRERPLASGRISVKHALLWLFSLCALALIDVLMLNRLSLYYAVIALALTGIYPLCKRFFAIPQLVLGFTFNFGIIIAFAASQNHVPFVAWLFYVSTLCWTIAYDTPYAMVDRDDDLTQNLKSSAILFGRFDTLWVGIFQLITWAGWVRVGIIQHRTPAYWIAMTVIAALFIYQQQLIKDRQKPLCFKAFLNNQWVGLVLFLGVFL
jgi:4-hydroxybenzoate polyprenyltransferase